MVKRLLLSCFLALVVCGVVFYVACFVGLIYTAATGPLNPANDPGLQLMLRRVALPGSVVLGGLTFVVAFRRLGRRASEKTAAGAK